MAGTDLVQALTRGLRILELAAASEDGVSVPQLTQVLGIKQPTAHNLTRTLLAHGYLIKRSSPVRYALGPAVEALVQQRMEHRWKNCAEETVRGLAAALPKATVILAERRAGDLAVTLRMHPGHRDHLERMPAMHLGPYTSSCMLCFQAFAPEPEVSEFRQRYPLGETDTGRWHDLHDLDSFLKTSRQTGTIVLADQRLYRVGVPVWGQEGRILGVLGTSRLVEAGFSGEDATTMLTLTIKAARTLSARIKGEEALRADPMPEV